MTMSDPIADMLTRMRNAVQARHEAVEVPESRIKREICRVLREQGFIAGYTIEEDVHPAVIRITLKYLPDGSSVLQGIRRVSKPSRRVYSGKDSIRPVRSGLGVAILTTSRGVMTAREARQTGVGGEILCEVW
mgnify:FL=1